MSWIEDEFVSIGFNDSRLNQGFVSIMENFSDSPSKPIKGAMSESSRAKAAYRFF
jgi:hypothetical protein